MEQVAPQPSFTINTDQGKSVALNWGLLGVLKDAGIVLALIWFMYHVMTVTLPTLQGEFHTLIGREREAFISELKAQRVYDEKRNSDLVGAIKELAAEIRKGK